MKKTICFFIFFITIVNLTFAQAPAWLWAKSAGGSNDDYSTGIDADVNGNSCITGSFFSQAISFENITLTNSGSGDIFLAKYDASGNVNWAKSAVGNSFDFSNNITMDATGNIYLTGQFESNPIIFSDTALNNYGTDNIFVVKYDPSGNMLWGKSAGGNSIDIGKSICVDVAGNIYMTGGFSGPAIVFGSDTLTNSGYNDIFIVKLANTNDTTGVVEEYYSDEINIYPNPGNGQIRIISYGIIDDVRIADIIGQNIMQAKPNEKELSLQLNKSGIYFVTITSSKHTTTRKLLVYH